MPRAIEDPILAYTAAEGEINQVIIIIIYYLFLFIIFINLIFYLLFLSIRSSGVPPSLTG